MPVSPAPGPPGPVGVPGSGTGGATGCRGASTVCPWLGVPGRSPVPVLPALGVASPVPEVDGLGDEPSPASGTPAPVPEVDGLGPPVDRCGSGEPGWLFVSGSPGLGTVASCAERTALPSTEPTSSVRPSTTAATAAPRRSTRRRSSHTSTRGPSRRQASPASRASSE